MKVANLASVLAKEPRYLVRYVKEGILAPTDACLHRGLPWFSFSAIEFLEQRMHSGMTVYEYGGGGSTIFFAERAARIVTVESDERWVEPIEAQLRRRHLANVELVLATADFDDQETFAQSPFALALPDEPADVVVIDSFDYYNGHPLRPKLFPMAEGKVKPGGMLVVDDSWRYPQLRNSHHAKSVVTKTGVGPARRTTTSTDFFLY
jgi:hypothetical protein